MRLDEMLTAFVEDACAGKTNETPSAYRSKLRHVEHYLGSDCVELNQNNIDTFRRFLLSRKIKRLGGKEVKEPLSRFTIWTVLKTTRHFLKWANRQGYIPEIQLMNIKEPRPDPKAVDQITVDSLLKAAAELPSAWERVRDIALIYVLRDTGGRAGAIARLDIDNLRLADGYATAPDKGDQLSWLYFNPPTVAAICDWLSLRSQLHPKDYRLFTGVRGRGLSRQGISRVLTRLAKAAGITGRHNPHSFRHAFARDALRNGADLGMVSELMGHKGIVVTHKYYARWKKSELKAFHKKYSPGKDLVRQGSAKP